MASINQTVNKADSLHWDIFAKCKDDGVGVCDLLAYPEKEPLWWVHISRSSVPHETYIWGKGQDMEKVSLKRAIDFIETVTRDNIAIHGKLITSEPSPIREKSYYEVKRNPSGKQQFRLVPVEPDGTETITTALRSHSEEGVMHVLECTFVLCAGCFSPVLEIGYKEHQLDCLPFLRRIAEKSREKDRKRGNAADLEQCTRMSKHKAHNWVHSGNSESDATVWYCLGEGRVKD